MSHSLTLFCIRKVVMFIFCNSEVMTSFPHNLVFDSQPRLGLKLSDVLKIYNFLISKRNSMKLVAKCSAFVSLSYHAHVKVCNPIQELETVQSAKYYRQFRLGSTGSRSFV